MKKSMNVVDLFCGAGGLSTGFSKAGFNILLGADNNPCAIETFLINHSESKILCKDMGNVTSGEILKELNLKKADVIVGGPPCQGFSMAGKRQPNDPRNSLFKEYVRLVKELNPKFFVMENVRGLLSMENEKGERVIDIILKEFNKIGKYNVELYKVNTADYGVPQRRQRIFIIGVNKKYNFSFPDPTHSKNPEKTKLKNWEGIKKSLFNRNKINKKYFYSEKLIKGFKRREAINKKKGVGFGWQFNDMNKPSYTISARYWKDGAESLVKYDNKTIRMLTPKECALIQSFPENYVFKGSEKEVYTQIGNSVPPLMAYALAKSIKRALTA